MGIVRRAGRHVPRLARPPHHAVTACPAQTSGLQSRAGSRSATRCCECCIRRCRVTPATRSGSATSPAPAGCFPSCSSRRRKPRCTPSSMRSPSSAWAHPGAVSRASPRRSTAPRPAPPPPGRPAARPSGCISASRDVDDLIADLERGFAALAAANTAARRTLTRPFGRVRHAVRIHLPRLRFGPRRMCRLFWPMRWLPRGKPKRRRQISRSPSCPIAAAYSGRGRSGTTKRRCASFMLSGAHREVMPRLLEWCDEASVVHWTQDSREPPSWAEALRRTHQDGRRSKVNHPSDAQRRFEYPETRGGTELKFK